MPHHLYPMARGLHLEAWGLKLDTLNSLLLFEGTSRLQPSLLGLFQALSANFGCADGKKSHPCVTLISLIDIASIDLP